MVVVISSLYLTSLYRVYKNDIVCIVLPRPISSARIVSVALDHENLQPNNKVLSVKSVTQITYTHFVGIVIGMYDCSPKIQQLKSADKKTFMLKWTGLSFLCVHQDKFRLTDYIQINTSAYYRGDVISIISIEL